ncbi:uncharacterized protein PFL1_02241 [Pseudozyma flocculosa PF-1]|uniref:Related to NOC3 protein, required for maturation and intranuclear transport of pre-ribosomes n=1 Tax=Pseudozyma flocculosa TaxID=84751 RepID=A0A5C3FCV4_9BASI|nr:uncharacterized protein PFL1_02241 [Pseudozyma flocculosa PF-1]EPQ30124.1 hypothetical protein PFL1_02241 [Pseudozyma flocculosa PF-1]SPO42263.1 related to NOC3 protein, required for maturation and intranuclear transport of pre-ribosomes [Pseudozyma flocculosa]
MPPKRSAAPKKAASAKTGFKAQSKARNVQSKASLKKQKSKQQQRRPRDRESGAAGDGEEGDSDEESAISDYADSDEVSQVSSDDDRQDDGDDDAATDDEHADAPRAKKPKTVAASSFAFLTNLEKDKSKPLTKKEENKLHAKRNKNDKLELAEAKKRIKAEQHAARLREQEEEEAEEEGLSDLSGMSDLDEEDDDLDQQSIGSEDWEEHSDVSEGEAVEQSDDERSDEPTIAAKGKKRKAGQDDDDEGDDDEARVLERLRKRKAREELEALKAKEANRNKRLPIRTADGQIVEADESSDDDANTAPDARPEHRDGDDDMDGLDEDDGDDDAEEAAHKDSRAVHAPLREDSPSSSQAAEEIEARARANATPHSSMLHSTRFNLTAPYEICLLGFTPPSAAAAVKGKAKAQAKAEANAAAARRMQMIQLARNQIASLASQIVADPEVSLNLLRRLAVFSERTVQPPPEQVAQIKMEQAQYKKLVAKHGGVAPAGATPPRPLKVQIDPAIRQLSLLSILAVLLDILPGYRIRSLSEKEQEEQVGQEVARRREYEQGLVSTYRDFLELCEQEVKDRDSPLHASALRCLTTLATRATHFNYRDNVLQCVVARMSRRRWGKDEESCYEALVEVVREDRQGAVSYEVVRLIHRMTKERRFKVNSRVLDILLELRLKDELGTKRASTETASDPVKEAEKERQERERKRIQNKVGKGKATPKEVRKGLGQHLSKKQSKKMKELKAIEAEMKEAEATVDLQEREKHQTETLKLLFVLYFTILKAPIGSIPLHLLGSALEGLSRFAHRVNVDFFRDLLAVLRVHITEARKRVQSDVDRFASLDRLSQSKKAGDDNAESSDEEDAPSDVEGDGGDEEERRERREQSSDLVHRSIRHALLCLNTAFELLSGQGDVLNLDLSDLTTHLYALMLPLSTLPDLEQDPDSNNPYSFGAKPEVDTKRAVYGQEKRSIKHNTRKTLADLLFRSLDLVLLFPPPRSIPIDRSASFVKRLCIIALQLPPASVQRSLKLVAKLIAREDRLLALVDTTDRAKDGVYDPVAANPDATAGGVLKCGEVLWELEALRRCGNLEVQELVDRIRNLGAQK